MPSKKNILHRLGELEKGLAELKEDIKEHYPQKSIDQVMKEAGFLITERENCGVKYVEFVKDGIVIDREDILASSL